MNELNISEGDKILRPEVVDDLTGLSASTRYRLEARNEFPKRIRLSENSVGYRLSEVRAWIDSRPRAAVAPIESPNPRRAPAAA